MIRPAPSFMLLSILAFIFSFIVPPLQASAETNVKVSNNGEGSTTRINVQSNTGGNTTCINGQCTTSDGNSKSKVCVNGECYESEGGSVNVNSVNGNTTVNITKDGKSTTKVTQTNQGNVESNVNVTTGNVTKEDIEKKVQGAKDEINKKKEEVKKEAEEATKGFDIMSFIQVELENIKRLLTFDFLFKRD